MVMNMSSNMMGLGNSATPFGLKAMKELARLNPLRGSASNAMVLFLAINTSAITLFPPFGTIAVRAAAGSDDPWAIWAPTLFATTCSTLAAVSAYFLLGRLALFRPRPPTTPPPLESDESFEGEDLPEPAADPTRPAPARWRAWVVWGFVAIVFLGLSLETARLLPELGAIGTLKEILSNWLMAMLISALLLIGVRSGVQAYDSMIAGGREGLEVAVRIVPYLVAILVAVASLFQMFQ